MSPSPYLWQLIVNMKSCPFDECRKTLSTPYKLKLHIQRFHYNLRLYQCLHCLKPFKSNDSLKRHMFCHRQAIPCKDTLVRRIQAFGEVLVPKLTTMVQNCEDLDLRPMTHIDRVYPFSYHLQRVLLPEIREGRERAWGSTN